MRLEASNLSDSEIDQMVVELQKIDCKSAWDRTLEVGRIVFEGLAKGDEQAWKSHKSQKSVSIRKLVNSPACPFRKTALNAAVSVHLFTRANPTVRNMAGIMPTHVAQVVGLPLDRALHLLNMTTTLGWSVRDLYVSVRAERKAAGENRGRPALSSEDRLVMTAQRSLTAMKVTQAQLSACADVASDNKQKILRVLGEIDHIVSEMQNLLLLSEKSRHLRLQPLLPKWESAAAASAS